MGHPRFVGVWAKGNGNGKSNNNYNGKGKGKGRFFASLRMTPAAVEWNGYGQDDTAGFGRYDLP